MAYKYRIFFKKQSDKPTEKSCEMEEIIVKDFNAATHNANTTAKIKNYRVAMIAELPEIIK